MTEMRSLEQVEQSYRRRGYGAESIGFGERPGIVVIDFQRLNTDPKYPLGGAPLVESAVQQTSKLLNSARHAQLPVAVCYMAYHGKHDTPFTKIQSSQEILREGHGCTELDPRIYDAEQDLLVRKPGGSIFFQTPVIPFFIRQRVDTVVITGCNTSGCVRASIIDAWQYGYRTIVPEDCVGDIEAEPHRSNLMDVGMRYADVVTSAEVIQYFEGL